MLKILKENLVNFRRMLLGGIVVLTVLTNVLPRGIALGEGAFAMLLLLIIAYLFEEAFYGIKTKK